MTLQIYFQIFVVSGRVPPLNDYINDSPPLYLGLDWRLYMSVYIKGKRGEGKVCARVYV